VLEREERIAAHQTGHSSGVIHAGIYYAPGSLKARLCVEGAGELRRFCERRGIPFNRSGKLIVATGEEQLPALAELERRGRKNRVPGLRRVAAGEIGEIEPHAAGVAALHSPETSVVDFAAVAAALAEEVEAGGGKVRTGVRVHPVPAGDSGIVLHHRGGELTAREAVFCAGLWSDRLAVACGAPADPRIVPFRGAYLRLRPERSGLVRGSVYPVPDPSLPFLGSHLSRGPSGEVMVGPSALLAGARDAYALRKVNGRDLAETVAWPGTWRLARRHWRAALGEAGGALSRRRFVAQAARLIPSLAPEDVLPGWAGVRAQALGRDGKLVDDFVLHRTGAAIHVRNAPSPAATSALALARLIADRLEQQRGAGG
jgi:(S)-2-hydroxyglutarate dehydrogenase